jgi:hypothetical protein
MRPLTVVSVTTVRRKLEYLKNHHSQTPLQLSTPSAILLPRSFLSYFLCGFHYFAFHQSYILAIMHYTTLCIASFACLAATMPATGKRDDPFARVIDPWGVVGTKSQHAKRTKIGLFDDGTINSTTIRIAGEDNSSSELLELAKRATTVSSFLGTIPGCESGDDPSNKDTPKPGYQVNQGIRLPKSGANDQCTTGKGNNKCWTVYYLVEAAVEYESWLPTGSAINCPADAGGSCSVQITSLQQSCSTTGSTQSYGHDKVLNAAISLGIKGPDGPQGQALSAGLSVGGGYTWTESKTDHDLVQVCKSETSATTCNWATPAKDGTTKDLCHQVWYADRVLHVWGQAQRECNKCTGDGVQQNSGDGKICVRGQKGFEFLIPINKLIQCDGVCNANDPGISIPPNGGRFPYQQPANWDVLDVNSMRPA